MGAKETEVARTLPSGLYEGVKRIEPDGGGEVRTAYPTTDLIVVIRYCQFLSAREFVRVARVPPIADQPVLDKRFSDQGSQQMLRDEDLVSLGYPVPDNLRQD